MAFNPVAGQLLQLPGVNGLDVQQALAARGTPHPIVFFSGQSDVPLTARAMREGAVDFLVKPLDEPQLIAAIERASHRPDRGSSWRRRNPVTPTSFCGIEFFSCTWHPPCFCSSA